MNRSRMITGAHDAATKGEGELYETPPQAVRALMAAEPFFSVPQRILEPACGPGQIVAALQAAGHTVTASDLFDYEARWKGAPDTERRWGLDFLDARIAGFIGYRNAGFRAVVMNPPYSKANDFVAAALQWAPRVYALLELGWIQGEAAGRCALVDDGPLIRVLPFIDRLDMHRDGFPAERRTNSTRKHAWFVFANRRAADAAPIEMRRISAAGA